VAARVKERLAVSKRTLQIFDIEEFNLKKQNRTEGKD
jgi:hypothetical protein